MVWPNWVKIPYWLLILGFVSWLLFDRLDITTAGHTTPFGAVVFVIWVALLLAPLFNEVKIWGVSLKQEIEKTQDELKDTKEVILREFNSVRMDVRNSIHFSPTFNHTVSGPPPDYQLPAIQKEIEELLPKQKGTGIEQQEKAVPKDTLFLFSVRFHIEQQVRRIMESFLGEPRLRTQIRLQVRFLIEHEAIGANLGDSIIEVYRICSPAVHGDAVTFAQLSFVKEIAPKLLAVLEGIPALLPD